MSNPDIPVCYITGTQEEIRELMIKLGMREDRYNPTCIYKSQHGRGPIGTQYGDTNIYCRSVTTLPHVLAQDILGRAS